MFHAIPRDAAGHIVLPGRHRTWDVDFSQVAALPSWLTATPGTGTVTITAGELVVTGPAGANNAYVQGPSFATSAIESVMFTAYDQHRTGDVPGQSFQAVSTVASMFANGGLGAMLHNPGGTATYLRGTVGDWPVTSAIQVDVEARTQVRTTRSVVILPRTGMVYAIEDESEVMHARDLSATMVAGTIAPIFLARAASVFYCSRIKIQVGYS